MNTSLPKVFERADGRWQYQGITYTIIEDAKRALRAEGHFRFVLVYANGQSAPRNADIRGYMEAATLAALAWIDVWAAESGC